MSGNIKRSNALYTANILGVILFLFINMNDVTYLHFGLSFSAIAGWLCALKPENKNE